MRRILLLITILSLLIIAWKTGLLDLLSLQALQATRDQWLERFTLNPLAMASAYMGVYIVVTALSLPGAAILTLAGGAIFGLAWGLILVSFASTLGATLAMLLARYLLRDWFERRFQSAARKIQRGFAKDGLFYLLSLRLVPLFPFFVVNALVGLTRIPALTFFWVSQIGMLPGTIIYVFAGTNLAGIRALEDILQPELLFSLALLGIFPWLAKSCVYRWRSSRLLKKFRKPKAYDYNLVVVGAGAAGLVSAYMGSQLQAKTLLIEHAKMGGDCLHHGCVPSKTLIRSAKQVALLKKAKYLGVNAENLTIDFPQVRKRIQEVIAAIEPHDSPERYRSLGVEVVQSKAEILDPWRVRVGGKVLTTRNLVIASGAGPRIPNLPGIDTVEITTSDTLWSLENFPKRLVVLGGGPIGCELAQSFARLGSQVTLIQRGSQILPKEDNAAAEIVRLSLAEDGVEILLSTSAEKISTQSPGSRSGLIHFNQAGEKGQREFDCLLVATGRKPRTKGFGLENLPLEYNSDGTIVTDLQQRTAIRNVFACGDVSGPFPFTHYASHQATIAVVNALFAPFTNWGRELNIVPRVTFTDPELAQVGLTENEAKANSVDCEITSLPFSRSDRALADSETTGFVKILTAPGKDTILGATIVGAKAGEHLAILTIAMKNRLGLKKILNTIHAYPTGPELIRSVAGEWARQHTPAFAKKWLRRFQDFRR